MVPRLLIASQMPLLAATTIWKSGSEKLMSTTPSNKRGSKMRAVYWLRRPWPHMIRYEAHSVITTSAASATTCTFGSSCWIVTLVMKSRPLSNAVAPRMKPNQTLSSSPTLLLRRATTTSFGCANGHSRSISCVRRTMRVWRSTGRSVGRHRVGQDADQGAGHLDANRPDHDALDPLLGGEGRLRLDGCYFPDEREDECQGADRSDQRLADVNPRRDEVGDRSDVRTRGEKVHVKPPVVLRERLGVNRRARNPGC